MDLTQVVHSVDPVKISRLRIQNSGSAPARLRVYAYAEWVLGSHRSRTAATIVPSRDAATGALLAQNPYGLDFSERVAFLAADGAAHPVTADRGEFIGRNGTSDPASRAQRRKPCRAASRRATILVRQLHATSTSLPAAT